MLLGIDEDDERQEEDEKLVLLLQIDVPHVECHTQLTRRRKQCTQLETPHKNITQTFRVVHKDLVIGHGVKTSARNHKVAEVHI